ncbi:MAG: hypothetical protein JNJ83_01935 [Verrucomicrobiaceae bacterium]|nr:hypothetical protein [Verrucomicrobiaceae bacterium]
MSATFTSGAIKRSIRKFTDYAGDLLKSDYNTFEDRLNVFIQFCSSDEVFSRIHEQLISVPNADFDSWFAERQATVGSFAGSGKLIFPAQPEERLSIMYQLLYGVYAGSVPFQSFTLHFFALGSSRYDDYIYAFNESVTQPLVRELAYRLDELDEQLPAEKTTEVSPSVIQIIHHATNVIQQHASGENIQQSATISLSPDLAGLFAQLRSAVASAGLPPAEAREAEEIVESAASEASQQRPRSSVLRALFRSLPASDAILSITSSIIEIISNTMG